VLWIDVCTWRARDGDAALRAIRKAHVLRRTKLSRECLPLVRELRSKRERQGANGVFFSSGRRVRLRRSASVALALGGGGEAATGWARP